MIGKILVAVDGSENSNRGLDFALDLAEKFGSVVTVLNVSETPAMGAVPMESLQLFQAKVWLCLVET